MNLPNKLSLLRIFLVPVLVFFLVYSPSRVMHLIAAIVFLVASMTDVVDGYVARKWGQVTTLGKLLDPIADKLLVSAALISLVDLQIVHAPAALIIIGREIAVTGLRSIAAANGIVIQASDKGKLKTLTQSVAIFLLILYMHSNYLLWSGQAILWVSVVLTVYSGYDYFRIFWQSAHLEDEA
jgi:CDP-diacylglycerol---glycerol-3-phosphate 3-phosphatidyltransferase